MVVEPDYDVDQARSGNARNAKAGQDKRSDKKHYYHGMLSSRNILTAAIIWYLDICVCRINSCPPRRDRQPRHSILEPQAEAVDKAAIDA